MRGNSRDRKGIDELPDALKRGEKNVHFLDPEVFGKKKIASRLLRWYRGKEYTVQCRRCK